MRKSSLMAASNGVNSFIIVHLYEADAAVAITTKSQILFSM